MKKVKGVMWREERRREVGERDGGDREGKGKGKGRWLPEESMVLDVALPEVLAGLS